MNENLWAKNLYSILDIVKIIVMPKMNYFVDSAIKVCV